MKKLICLLLMLTALVSCGETPENSSVEESSQSVVENSESSEESSETSDENAESSHKHSASSDENEVSGEPMTLAQTNVVEEGMVPIYADQLRDGVYQIKVRSSAFMFRVIKCELTVENGTMSALMTMSGTGYTWVFMGDRESAENAPESEYIPYIEEDGVHKFRVPVEALDMGIPCAAYGTKRDYWYDRTILFRADSLPEEAFIDSANINSGNTIESLGIADGEYTVEVTLEGGSGKAGIAPHTQLTVQDGQATARIEWSSNNYDYMVIDDEQYLPLEDTENSTFDIPVSKFDMKVPVSADTTAMSVPHEIEYTLYFDSSTITPQ
ncbi:MAG: hypothetical protein K2J39_10795 [Ruminococcus sp.]|nr:hypothetical protein [Ruminococcus sp.]